MINVKIHKTADVQSESIGPGTNIWQSVVVLPGARIGADVNICAHCFVENDVVIGDRVTVKSGVYLWDGVRLDNDVFVGPNVTFTNDKFPRSKAYPDSFKLVHVEKGASVGGGGRLAAGCNYWAWGDGRCRCRGHEISASLCDRLWFPRKDHRLCRKHYVG